MKSIVLSIAFRRRSPTVAMELDVAADGTITQTEEKVELSAVPAAVMKATRAEKGTHAGGGVFFELGFTAAGAKKHEATFAADGTFVEE